MQAIVLAGGMGTRLRPLTLTRPKCLLPLLNVPIIEHVVASLPKYVDEVFMTLGAVSKFPEDWLRGRFPDKRFEFMVEYEPLGTGGPIKALEDRIESDFMVLNGDVISSLDLKAFKRFHDRKKGLGTISLHSAENPQRYGVVQLDDDERLARFEEKPATPFSNLINAGYYIFSKDIFGHFPEKTSLNLEREVFARVATEMFGFVFEGYWMDSGTPQSFLEANFFMLSKKGTSTETDLKDVDVRGNVFVADSKVNGGTLGPNALIGDYNIIRSAAISNSVVFDRTRIDSHTEILNSIIGDSCVIGKNCYIDGCILGDGVAVEDGARMRNRKMPHSV
jgi:NDP-sugar pyrophosphorylase family protein